MNARLSYREAEVPGASPLRLVILLYEQALEDLRCAREAYRRNDIEGRTRRINHAILVIGHLQASLDKERGGPVAANLERFYDRLRIGLVEAQCRQSAAGLEQQISHLTLVQQAWCKAERSEAERAAAANRFATSPSLAAQSPAQCQEESARREGPEPRASAEWNA